MLQKAQKMHHCVPVFLKSTLSAQSDSRILADSLLLFSKSHFRDYVSPSFRLARSDKITHV